MEKQNRKQQIGRRKLHLKRPSHHSCRKFLIRQLFGRQALAWGALSVLQRRAPLCLCGWPAPGARTLRMKRPRRKAAFPPRSHSRANRNTHIRAHTYTHTHTHTHTHTYSHYTAHRHPLPWKLTGRRKESRNPLRIITLFFPFLSFVRSFFLSCTPSLSDLHTHTHTHTQTHTPLFQCSLRSFGDCASGLCSPMMNDLPKNT